MRAALIVGFVVLVALLAIGLTRDPREVPSPLIGKPAPAFDLPRLADPSARFSPAEMRGKVWVLNVWASWCPPCLQEHPHFVAFAKAKRAPLVGLNYKDQRDDALKWLARHGDPYDVLAADVDGRVGIDYGVYGVPETYVIDKAGTIRFKQVGPVTAEIMERRILPLLAELQK